MFSTLLGFHFVVREFVSLDVVYRIRNEVFVDKEVAMIWLVPNVHAKLYLRRLAFHNELVLPSTGEFVDEVHVEFHSYIVIHNMASQAYDPRTTLLSDSHDDVVPLN